MQPSNVYVSEVIATAKAVLTLIPSLDPCPPAHKNFDVQEKQKHKESRELIARVSTDSTLILILTWFVQPGSAGEIQVLVRHTASLQVTLSLVVACVILSSSLNWRLIQAATNQFDIRFHFTYMF